MISALSPRNTGDAHKDAQAFAEALIAAQRSTGRRLVMVGGAGTLHLPDGTPVADTAPEAYREEARAMRKVYCRLVSEDIDFTFLAPAGVIQPGERTGKFRIGGRVLLLDEEGNSRISAEDYAMALIDEVETPKALSVNNIHALRARISRSGLQRACNGTVLLNVAIKLFLTGPKHFRTVFTVGY